MASESRSLEPSRRRPKRTFSCTSMTVSGVYVVYVHVRDGGGPWRVHLKSVPWVPRGTSLRDPEVRFKGAVLHKSSESVIRGKPAQMCHRIGENVI